MVKSSGCAMQLYMNRNALRYNIGGVKSENTQSKDVMKIYYLPNYKQFSIAKQLLNVNNLILPFN